MPLAAMFVAFMLSAVAAPGAIEYSAFLAIGGQPRFVLTDLEDHTASDWLTLGQSFHGFQLVAYDAARGVLVIRNSGADQELTLKGSHVAPAPIAPVPPALAARGITAADLVVRDRGPVRIRLTVGATLVPAPRRFIDVRFDNGTDRCGVEFGLEGPQGISRSFVPEAVRSAVTDDDIAAINARLATVRGKWLPERP